MFRDQTELLYIALLLTVIRLEMTDLGNKNTTEYALDMLFHRLMTTDHSTVVRLVPWFLSESETGVDFVLIQTDIKGNYEPTRVYETIFAPSTPLHILLLCPPPPPPPPPSASNSDVPVSRITKKSLQPRDGVSDNLHICNLRDNPFITLRVFTS